MVCILILILIAIILNILIIGTVFSKVSINIENCNMFSNYGIKGINIDKMQISVDLYLYKLIKILSVKFYKEYLKIGFIKIYYYKILEHKKEIIAGSAQLTKLLLGKNKLSLSILNANIESFYMNLNLCSENAAITSLASSIIGTTTSMILSKLVKKYDEEKIFYKIIPVYFNINGFKIEFRSKVNIDTLNIFVFLYDYYLVKNNK